MPPNTLNPLRRGFWTSVKDRLWGYDFFISYHWVSGGTYAVNLAQRLREQNYDVFLDRADYASGDDWKAIGEIALRNTQRLVLIATRDAVTISKPVEHEVALFTARNRQVISIVFGDRFADLDRTQYVTLNMLSDSKLYIEDDKQALAFGPSEKTVAELIRTQGVMRRRNLRALLTLIPAVAVIAFAAFATVSWGNAELAKRGAEAARENAVAAKKDAELERDKALLNARLATARQWAALAVQARNEFPQRSILLAIKAVNATRPTDPPVASAEQSLRDSMAFCTGIGFDSGSEFITSLAISRDGSRFATGDVSGTVQLWELKSPEVATRYGVMNAHKGRVSVALSPDGRWLLSGSWDGTANLWNLTTDDPQASPIPLGPHRADVRHVGFTPDSRWAITACHDRSIRLWNLVEKSSPTAPIVLPHNGGMETFAVTTDSRWLATATWAQASGEHAIVLWDLHAIVEPSIASVLFGRKPLHLLKLDMPAQAIATSPDNRWLAVAKERGTIALWEILDSGPKGVWTELSCSGEPYIYSLAFSQNSRFLAASGADGGYGGRSSVWDLTSLKPEQTIAEYTGYPGFISASAFSTDGTRLILGGGNGHEFPIEVWDFGQPTSKANPVKWHGHDSAISSVAVTNNNVLVTTSRNPRVWKLDGESPTRSHRVLRKSDQPIQRIATSADGNWLASVGEDWEVMIHAASRFDAATPGLKLGRGREPLAFSPTGTFLAASLPEWQDGRVRVWDIGDVGAENSIHCDLRCPGGAYALKFSRDGELLIAGTPDGDIYIWRKEKRLFSDAHIHLQGHVGGIVALAISTDNKYLASSSSGNSSYEHREIRFWRLDANNIQESHTVLQGHAHGFGAVASDLLFTQDGRHLVEASSDGTVRMWSIDDLPGDMTPLSLTCGTYALEKLASTLDGRTLIATSQSGSTYLWNVAGQDVSRSQMQLRGHTEPVWCCALSADSRWLLTGSGDRTARIWDLNSEDPAQSSVILRGHSDRIYSVALSRDGRWAITSSLDGTVRVWPISINELVRQARIVVGRDLLPDEL